MKYWFQVDWALVADNWAKDVHKIRIGERFAYVFGGAFEQTTDTDWTLTGDFRSVDATTKKSI